MPGGGTRRGGEGVQFEKMRPPQKERKKHKKV